MNQTKKKNDSRERKQKKRIIFAEIAAVAVIGAIGMFYYATNALQSVVQASDSQDETLVNEPVPTDFPHETEIRTGIPILRAVEVISPAESLYFYPINKGEHEYLWRAVEKGSTFLSNKEMETYFTTFNEKGYRFAMQTADGTEFYRIRYSEPPISTDTHWIKIFVYDDQKQGAKPLSDLDKSRLSLALENPYSWVPVDEQTALLTKILIETQGQDFKTITKEGDKSFQVMYLGALSEELKEPEFQAMYALDSGAGH